MATSSFGLKVGVLMGKDVLGLDAKIGVLVPATNTIVQPEFEQMRPAGVSNHTARVVLGSNPADYMTNYRETVRLNDINTKLALDTLLPCEPDILAIGHSHDSFEGGLEGAREYEEKHVLMSGLPTVVPSLAMVAALEALGRPKRLAILTPYTPEGDEMTAAFFDDVGYTVVSIVGLHIKVATAIAELTRHDVTEWVRSMDSSKVDAHIQVGTNLAMASFAPALVNELKKPVLTINTATYWNTLNRLGLKTGSSELFGCLAS
jgi:maleate isomerase